MSSVTIKSVMVNVVAPIFLLVSPVTRAYRVKHLPGRLLALPQTLDWLEGFAGSTLFGPFISYKEKSYTNSPLESYSKHSIFFLTNEWAQKASVCHWQAFLA